MDEMTTLVSGVRVSAAEQAAMECSEVRELERERNGVLDSISHLNRQKRRVTCAADRLRVAGEVKVLQKRARILYDAIGEEIAKRAAVGRPH